MQTLDTYIGIEPFNAVLVDDSPQLRALLDQARGLRGLPFTEKMTALKKLALGAMINAYEAMHTPRNSGEYEVLDRRGGTNRAVITESDKATEIAPYKDIVKNKHPLSYALEHGAGCCRYQGTLFFVLGYEANLGDRHFLQSAVVNPSNTLPLEDAIKTVFNEVFNNGERHVVSIFRESVTNPEHDYTRKNPEIFNKAIRQLGSRPFFSYHRTPSGLVIVSNPGSHIDSLS